MGWVTELRIKSLWQQNHEERDLNGKRSARCVPNVFSLT